ncbi:MAG: spermidine synthase [Arenicella sp.]|jgi:spermidine synthase
MTTAANIRWYKDTLLLTIMAIGAACGIVYEYLLAHYAGRVLGTLDTAVYGMIGVMVASMGVGAFFARTIGNPYTGFAWLEAIISIVGGTSVLLMAAVVSYAFVLPSELQQTFGLDPSVMAEGGPIYALREVSKVVPFIIGAMVGFFVGMEIPLIARIREDIHGSLKNNAGTVYGIDYIGGGIGAAIWVLICLTQPIIVVAAATALLNLLLGAIFAAYFWDKVGAVTVLILIKIVVCILLIGVLMNGGNWINAMNSMLYKDQVVYENNTRFQNLVITSRIVGGASEPILNLYINGRLQFSTADENIYHAMLVVPAMEVSARTDKVLVIGGGDGLAARDILKYNPTSLTLVDLDPAMTKLFTGRSETAPNWLNERLVSLNKGALSDDRLSVINQDAFIYVEELTAKGEAYDVIIVDLPDPNHPDLNKLYSAYFYRQLAELLSGDGALVIQSTSPYHSKNAFISIGATVTEAGFQVEQYHTNIPSFGEWGWTIATERGETPLSRFKALQTEITNNRIVDRDFIIGAFSFPVSFYSDVEQIKSNQLNSPVLYKYHSDGWRRNQGVFINQPN